jgi:hypothetical protein
MTASSITAAPVLVHQGSPGGAESSSLYGVLPEHVPALAAAVAVPFVVTWLVRSYPLTTAGPRNRPALWLLTTSAFVHAGLVAGHDRSMLTVLYAIDAAALALVVRRLVLGRSWRLAAAGVLVAGILAYMVSLVNGSPPDQLGLATKLVEVAALAVVVRPERDPAPWRRLAGSTAIVALVVLTGLAGWTGAFLAAEADDGGAGSHHGGAMPQPSSVMRHQEDRAPTAAEQAAAADFYDTAAATLASYADPDAAGAAGYRVDGMRGDDFHAAHPGYQGDGRIFDPERPENLIYAVTDRGPVLLGAMFEMPEIGQRGPAIGGPLTVWHEHENVCLTLVPPGLSGLQSPFGLCPIGSILLPRTPEMLHLWVVPGAPRFGDIDDDERAEYLARFEQDGSP